MLRKGFHPGGRVGILIDRSVDMYVALIGAQKAGAAFVPIDPSAPADRVQYIAEDAQLDLVLTTSTLHESCANVASPLLLVDRLADEIALASAQPPLIDGIDDPLAYIIYTSGSTGRPKGVQIAQSSICNFINVVPDLYGVTPSERVYQGMTISFDFSIEEIWPTWAKGATLIAGPTDGRNIGPGLADFLQDNAVTMIYCVPTVLATLDRTIPSIHTVNVGGEACPQELVERWGNGRRILNTYGPTEATVTCLYAELYPGKPVTVGRPLPTYTAYLLDEQLRPVAPGDVGEICVGGIGVARGYANRPEQTAERFVVFDNGTTRERIYRTGDLGRLTPEGEIEYRGRADSEVKVRGHRVDMAEIENVLLEDDAIAVAVLTLRKTEGTGGELAAYVTLSDAGASADPSALRRRLHGMLKSKLPGYMVPDYLEVVRAIPMLPSGKADRKSLPEPVAGRLVGGAKPHIAATTSTEELLVSTFAGVLNLPTEMVSVVADLFDDLGGHSLVAATIVSRLRASGAAGSGELSILDLYGNPTIRDLARYIDGLALEARVYASDRHASQPAEHRPPPPAWWRIAAFTLGQLSSVYTSVLVSMLPLGIVYHLNEGVPGWNMIWQLVATLPASYLISRWLLPILIARTFSAGLRPGSHPLYGIAHLRVWTVHRALRQSPLARLTGSPLATPYLRAAGALVGRRVHVGTAEIPLPSMVRLRDASTIGYGVHLEGYEIVGGRLRIGRIDVGTGATVSANCVLQGPCTIGDLATLGAQSLLLPGHSVPANADWAGSPAQPRVGHSDPVIDTMTTCTEAPQRWPRQLLPRFAAGIIALELLPMMAMVPILLAVWWSLLEFGQLAALIVTALSGPVFVLTSCLLILYLRRFSLLKTPVGVHHLRSQLGMEKWLSDKLFELGLELVNPLFGTLYTPIWLRLLGAKVGRGAEIATIANIDPDLLTLEHGAFVADMASVGSATYANGHVAFRRTEVGERAFVGNASFVPSGTRLSDGSLIGVQSVPPVTGVPKGTSWLGSPSIYLPAREMYDEFTEETTFAPPRRKVVARLIIEFLRATLSPALLGLSTFGTLSVLAVLAPLLPMWAMVLATPAIALVFGLAVVLMVAALKWLIVGRYRPRVEPLWSSFVRRTEFITGIYEGAAVPALLDVLTGTPLLGPLLRLFGVHVGKRTLIDTTYVTEFDLVHIGDDVSVGAEVSLQSHLFEDRVMKMGEVRLEREVALGCRAVVLYGTTLRRGAALAPLSLAMKGETLPADTSWAGIPARIAPRIQTPEQ